MLQNPNITKALTSALLAGALTVGSAAAGTVTLDAPVQVPDHNTLIVVSSNSYDAPVLERLPFRHMSADALLRGGLRKGGLSLEQKVAMSAGVYADVSLLTSGEMKNHPIFEAALDAGVPMILARVGEGIGVGEITGLGVTAGDGEVILVQGLSENQAIVHRVGAEMGVAEGDVETLKVDTETGERVLEVSENPAPMTRILTADPAQSASEISEYLFDHKQLKAVMFPELLTKADVLPECRTGSCYQWFYSGSNGTVGDNHTSNTWSITGTSQSPNFSIRYVVTLYDSINPDAKFVTFHTLGHMSTGGLYVNGSKDRGYFNEDMRLATKLTSFYNGQYYPTYNPSQNLTLLKTSPENANNVSHVTTSESIKVGVSASPPSGDGVSYPGVSTKDVTGSVEYTASWSFRRPVSDFEVSNTSGNNIGIGGEARWVYDMSASTGGAYNHWEDLISGGCTYDLHGLSNIALNNLQPATLSIWSVQRSFREWAQFELRTYQELRHTWKSGGTRFICDLTYEFSTATWWGNDTHYVWVDFDTVHQ